MLSRLWLSIVALLIGTVSAQQANSQSFQRAAEVALGSRQGSVVVLEAKPRGRLLAVVHSKTAAMRLAAPGSTVKPFILRELLRLGRLRPEEPIACRRTVRLNGRNFDCSHAPTPEPMSAVTALAYSCNSFFEQVATRLTPMELANALVAAGFNSRSGLADPEQSGSVTQASTPDQQRLQALGEYGIQTTPFALARAYQALTTELSSSDRASVTVRDGLLAATEYGMARLGRPARLTVAGKTGTSRAREGAWTHGWFAGYAPAVSPRVVIVVYLERGQGRDAAEVGGAILSTLPPHGNSR